jgi:hypothetical protein
LRSPVFASSMILFAIACLRDTQGAQRFLIEPFAV